MSKFVTWQKIFFLLNAVALVLLPLAIMANPGLVLFGALVIWPIELGLHALNILLGIGLLFCIPAYKKTLPPGTPNQARPGLLIFLIILNILILTVGGFFTYLIASLLQVRPV